MYLLMQSKIALTNDQMDKKSSTRVAVARVHCLQVIRPAINFERVEFTLSCAASTPSEAQASDGSDQSNLVQITSTPRRIGLDAQITRWIYIFFLFFSFVGEFLCIHRIWNAKFLLTAFLRRMTDMRSCEHVVAWVDDAQQAVPVKTSSHQILIMKLKVVKEWNLHTHDQE